MSTAIVLGSGIVGLWTADVLSRAGHDVIINARSGSANSTSAAAAGVLVPLFPGDPMGESFKRNMRWAKETLLHMQTLDVDHQFLERMPCYEFGLADSVEYDFPLSKLDYVDYFSTFTVLDLNRIVAGCNVAVRFDCYLCNSMVFLQWLFEVLMQRGVKFRYLNLQSISDLHESDADCIFNCMGYQSVFPDPELYPVFGQSMYVPVEEQLPPLFGIGAGEHAVFKHKRGFHVGAYFLQGDARTMPRGDLYERSIDFVKGGFVELCKSVGIAPPSINLQDVQRVNAGVRPFRASGPRVEVDRVGSKMIVHNYGHGAHGWTVGYGSAVEAARLARLI